MYTSSLSPYPFIGMCLRKPVLPSCVGISTVRVTSPAQLLHTSSEMRYCKQFGVKLWQRFVHRQSNSVLAFASGCTENKALLTSQALPESEASLCSQRAFVALCANCCCFWDVALLSTLNTTVDSCSVMTQTRVNPGYCFLSLSRTGMLSSLAPAFHC